MIEINEKAPELNIPDQNNKIVKIEDFKGRWLVLYFYPKDNTPGCTKEACEFTSMMPQFQGLDASIVGVSPDSIKKHNNFIEKQDLKIQLLSDMDKNVLKAYGAWGPKKLYGREYEGVIRSTFLIGPDQHIAHVWPSVRVKGHVEAVIKKLEELKG